jgi:hypothetical protein
VLELARIVARVSGARRGALSPALASRTLQRRRRRKKRKMADASGG